MEKRQTGGMNVGTSSVLVAFVLLCLVTFAGLSFLSANSDYRLSLQTAEKTSEYYAASGEADRRLAELDTILTELAQGASESSYYQAVKDRFLGTIDYDYAEDGESYLLSFTEQVNNRQDLKVKLKLNYPTDGTAPFSIESYTVVVNQSWQDEIASEIDENGLIQFD
ncbi:MAG: hypothetical protein IJT16_10090 [Lachnospiraceae bacterium]|nr:hypothetical protein [Lachnospiraceae bacterium]